VQSAEVLDAGSVKHTSAIFCWSPAGCFSAFFDLAGSLDFDSLLFEKVDDVWRRERAAK